MDDVVERVAQYRTADVFWVTCIEHAVTLHLYLSLQILEGQIEEVAPVAAVAGLVLVFPEDALFFGRLFHVGDDDAYRVILAENSGACQVLQFKRPALISAALALGALTGLVVKGSAFPLWRAATSSASVCVVGP